MVTAIFLISAVLVVYLGFVLGMLNQVHQDEKLKPVAGHVWTLPIVLPCVLLYEIIRHKNLPIAKMLLELDELAILFLHLLARAYQKAECFAPKKANAKKRKMKEVQRKEYGVLVRKVPKLAAAVMC